MRRKPLRVAFQGERGAHSEEAARLMLGDDIRLVPRPTFDSLFRAIADQSAEYILAPVENSLAGSVQRVYDLLAASSLLIVGEVVHRIAHHLIGAPNSSLRTIRSVESHPVALAQCELFFAAHPELKRIATDDTAGSAREVIGSDDSSRAAIAGSFAAALYGGKILRRHVEDHAENHTRFLTLAAHGEALRRADKLSILFLLKHQPGALSQALAPLARHNFNLLKIESRPLPGRPWEYCFYLDAQTLPNAVGLDKALRELKNCTRRLRILGHYARANKVRLVAK
jgi:prephenate dehydratase